MGRLPSVGTLLLLPVLVLTWTPAWADNAPMRPTTAGLVPGMPGTTVRMADEKVDIKVLERDGAVHALVTATFNLVNRGPSVTLTTGFPKYSGGSYFVAGGFAGFDPTQFANFQAVSGQTVFQPTVQHVASSTTAQQLETQDWFVWQMDYPANQTTNVQVTYDQTLSSKVNGFTYVSYILRTGALWDGTIGLATVTMTAEGGGSLLVPTADEAKQAFAANVPSNPDPRTALPTSSSPTQVTWQLSDFKPTFDPFAFYIPADATQRMTSTQARLALDAPASADYAAAVAAFFDGVGRNSSGLPWLVRHRPPLALTSRFEQVASWAEQATNLDSQNPAAFDGLGDAQYAREVHPTLYIDCRPQLAPIAYQTAVDLGSSTAQARLDDISQQVLAQGGKSRACSIDPDHPVPDPIPDTLTEPVRTEILAAIDRANSAWSDTNYNLNASELDTQVAGQALIDDRAEIARLQQAHQRRGNKKLSFDVLDMQMDAPGHATVHTRETWSAQIFDMGSIKVIQVIPPTEYTETYIVEFQDGGWIVTRNDT